MENLTAVPLDSDLACLWVFCNSIYGEGCAGESQGKAAAWGAALRAAVMPVACTN